MTTSVVPKAGFAPGALKRIELGIHRESCACEGRMDVCALAPAGVSEGRKCG